MSRKLDRCERNLRVREVRCTYHSFPVPGELVITPCVAAMIMNRHFDMTSEPVEIVAALFLDSRKRLVAAELLYRGTLNSALVSPRDAIRTALLLNCAAIIVGHNHPSGAIEPSSEDLGYTRRLVDAGRVLGIDVDDHVIIGFADDGFMKFCSMKERGLM